MTALQNHLRHARFYEKGPAGMRDLDAALRLYEDAIAVAPAGSRELSRAMQGARRIHQARGQDLAASRIQEEIDAIQVEKTLSASRKPWTHRLFIPEEELLQLPYVREHQIHHCAPWKFSPKKQYFGNQAVIVAVVWGRGTRYLYPGRIFWLKDYDEPFTGEVYRDGHRPAEARDPEYVLRAVRGQP